MKILFAGTPDIAVPTLRSLASHFTVAAVLTATDKIQGRKKILTPPPVKQAALALGIPVIQADHLGSAARAEVAPLGCDTLVCFAYGRIFGPKFLSLFKLALNIHPSLLPVLRGPSPIQGAILTRQKETGISIQKIAARMDSGDLAAQMHIPLDGTETAQSLAEKVAALAAPLAVKTLSEPLSFTPQRGEPSYCRLITREDGLIDWKKSAEDISAQARGLYPWPRAYTAWKDETLFIDAVGPVEESGESAAPGTVLGKDRKKGIAIATGDGVLWVTRLQRQQKKSMDALSFLNGSPAFIGSVLG